MRHILAICLFCSPAFAQEGLRASDRVLNQAELTAMLTGQMVEFFDGSKSRYEAGGRYIYTYTDAGPEWVGAYELLGESRVCVTFDNGTSRCDHFVQSGERLVLIIEDGTRFPVRNRTVYPE